MEISTLNIPDDFAGRMLALYGDDGARWLELLPRIIAECTEHWSLSIGPACMHLSFNYVTTARRADGSGAILKVGFPTRELWTEVEALRLFNGDGMTRLLDVSLEHGALLLERLEPGLPLSSLAIDDDERATEIAGQVMRGLWRPVPEEHHLPTMGDWVNGLQRLRSQFQGGSGPLPTLLIEQAEALAADLLSSAPPPVLLHGDLHHDNILSAQRRPWLAIDPKGVIGEPTFEIGALLYNPLPRIATVAVLERILAHRIDQLAEQLGLERQRVHGWGLVRAVLSAWWSIEDTGEGWEPALAVAEALARISA